MLTKLKFPVVWGAHRDAEARALARNVGLKRGQVLIQAPDARIDVVVDLLRQPYLLVGVRQRLARRAPMHPCQLGTPPCAHLLPFVDSMPVPTAACMEMPLLGSP